MQLFSFLSVFPNSPRDERTLLKWSHLLSEACGWPSRIWGWYTCSWVLMLERQGHHGQRQLNSTKSESLTCLLQEEETLHRRKRTFHTELTPLTMARAHVGLISTGPLLPALLLDGSHAPLLYGRKLMDWICLSTDLAQRDTCSCTYSDTEVLAYEQSSQPMWFWNCIGEGDNWPLFILH